MPRKPALVGVFAFALLSLGVVYGPSLGQTVPSASAVPTTPIGTRPTASGATPGPTATTSGGRAAYCGQADALTPYHAYADYGRTFLDWTYALPSDYAPPDLVAIAQAGFTRASRAEVVRGIVVDDLRQLRSAAITTGAPLEIISGYRSYAEQDATFAYWVKVGGLDQAMRTSARAGHSEHQLGTAIDFASSIATPPWEVADWGATPTGRWLAANAWRYGFVLSYPAGKENVTCYSYEPWHYRWIGRDAAAALRESGLTLREFLAR